MARSLSAVAADIRQRAIALGIRLPMAKLNNAISFAYVNKPYSAVVAADRAGKLQIPPVPLFIESAAAYYGIDANLFRDAFPAAASERGPEVGFHVRVSPRLEQRPDGTLNTCHGTPTNPLWRFLLLLPDGSSFVRWSPGAPSADDIRSAIVKVRAMHGLGPPVVVIPKSTERAFASCLNTLRQEGIVAGLRISSKSTETGSAGAPAMDKLVSLVNWQLNNIAEGHASLSELLAASGSEAGALIVSPSDRTGIYASYYDFAKKTAEVICKNRGRDPKRGRERADRSVIGAPTNTHQATVAEEDPLLSIRRIVDEGTHHLVEGWKLPHIDSILTRLERWTTTIEYAERAAIEHELGQDLIHDTITIAREIGSETYAHHVYRAFTFPFGKSKAALGRLLDTWSSRELSNGVDVEGMLYSGRRLVLELKRDHRGTAGWLRSIPFPELFRASMFALRACDYRDLQVAFGVYATDLNGRVLKSNHSHFLHALWHCMEFPSCWSQHDYNPKKSALCGPSNTSCYGKSVLSGYVFVAETGDPKSLNAVLQTALEEWVAFTNKRLEKWNAECSIASARLESSHAWPVDNP